MVILDDTNFRNVIRESFVALGSFDGFHLGHLALVDKAISLAEDNNGKSMIFTFKNHPRTLVTPNEKLELIMTNDEKIDVLRDKNIDILAFKTFDEEIMRMNPEEFIKWICLNYSVRGIVVGFNFKFGYKNLGDVELLTKLKEKYNYDLWVINPYILNQDIVSSTKIRKLLLDGNVESAFSMLSRPYSLSGEVIHGRKIGRTIGFPTANIKIPPNKIIPAVGVYYTNVKVEEQFFKGITSVGHNPTVNGKDLTVETFILDFSGDIYGKNITVYFLEKMRDEKKFNGINELICQLKKDKEYADKKQSIINRKMITKFS